MTPIPHEHRLGWPTLVSIFHVCPASTVLSMPTMERHQEIRGTINWLTEKDPPFALLFISHRWETLTHPDPDGSQIKAVQQFLQHLAHCIEAMLVSQTERIQLVPSLLNEGTMQAEEITRRILGFGPFSTSTNFQQGSDIKKDVKKKFEQFKDDRPAFRTWLLNHIGVWLDYLCMPQKPLASTDEEREFRKVLGSLDSLVTSSTLVALRQTEDDYSVRGWCASEYFLGSAHSFSRAIFLNISRLEEKQKVEISANPISAGPTPPDVSTIMKDSYNQDFEAFLETCNEWATGEGPLIESFPPSPWSAYRDLQGSTFFPKELDPNPSRRAMEVIRNMETTLIEKWLFSSQPCTLDLGKELETQLNQNELRCADQNDLPYLGLVLLCHGWIEAFQLLFRKGLERFSSTTVPSGDQNHVYSAPPLLVTLQPLPHDVRQLFFQVTPSSAATWNSRLSSTGGSSLQERTVIDQVVLALSQQPPTFTFL